MGQVFLSYRHVEPDQGFAEALCDFFERQGLAVFIDKRIQVGLDWVQEIDRQLRVSRAFVVLLSESSVRSDMMRQEVQIAHELWREGKMTIFPIRVGFGGELPYDLASYLNRIQYVSWWPGEAMGKICEQVYSAITGDGILEGALAAQGRATVPAPPTADIISSAPLPAADLHLVLETGTVRLDSPFYVRRREDGLLERCLGRQGSTIVIKGPRQIGKSSLLSCAHGLSRREGRRSVYVDFQAFDDSQLSSLGATLQALASRIAHSLKTPVRPSDVWDSELLGDKGSFSAFLEMAVLAPSAVPFVLILDEVDRLFDRSYRGDFFSAVRGWHNHRATEEAWESLHLVLAHATDPTLWIENLNESPFNVGERLRLGDFTRDQVTDLNARHGSPLRETSEIDGLIRLVGGHPYLVRQALYIIATEEWRLTDLERVAVRDDGPFGDHLRRHLWSLYQGKRLREAASRVVRGQGCEDEALFHRLLAVGLVVGETRGEARMRCSLYQSYFARHL